MTQIKFKKRSRKISKLNDNSHKAIKRTIWKFKLIKKASEAQMI